MSVSFVAAGAIGESATVTPITVTAPACQSGDILIATIINKEITVTISPPDSTWTELYQGQADATLAADDFRAAVYWKRATGSGGSFSFSKSADNNVEFAGIISAWRGCVVGDSANPIDATAVGNQVTTAVADNVTFPAFDPTAANGFCHVVFVAFYGNDLTTFSGTMSSSAECVTAVRYDLESSTGTDFSIAVCSGDASGNNIASRTWASASTADSSSIGVVFGLLADTSIGFENYKHAKAQSANAGILSMNERIR
jgi:hypothetical protein